MSHGLSEDPFKRRCSIKDRKKAILLTKTDLNRIISHAEILQSEKEDEAKIKEKKKQREACKELTQAFSRTKKVGNILKKKQYEKDVQCAIQELDREAKMEIRKKYVLDKAYKKLYEETDRVKHFKAAKNFCEALKDREDQVLAKTSQQEKLAEYDAQLYLGLLRDMDDHKEEERAKELNKKEIQKKSAADWIKQYNEVLQKKTQEKWDSLREGFLIKDELAKDGQKGHEKTMLEKQIAQNYKHSLDKQIKDKILLLEMRQQLDDAEDERARLFNEAKREMVLEHKKLLSELENKKSEKKRFVADNIYDEKSALKHKEEAALQKAVQQAEDKVREENEKKLLRQAEAQKAIDEFYKSEKARRQKQKYEEKLKNFQDKRAIDDMVDNLKAVEDSKDQKRHQMEIEAQHIQLHQIVDRKVRDKSKEVEALEDYLHHMRGLDEEEEVFQKYAKMEIEEAESRGVNTYAMRKAARPGIECGKGPLFEERGNIRPRYYSAFWNPVDLLHMSRNSYAPDTKSRLGFLHR